MKRARTLDASRGSVDVENLLLLKDVAPDQGVSVDALKKLLQRHDRRVYRMGRHLAARIQDLEWAAAHREHLCVSAPRRPKGWLGRKQVCDRLSLDTNAVTHLHKQGKLTAVRVGRMYFFDPEIVEALRLKREPLAPGWVSLPDLARERGWKYPTLHRAVTQMRLTTRTYHAREGIGRRTRQCIRETDLPAVTARMTLPASYPGRLTTAGLADVTGVKPQAVRFWVSKGLPVVKDRMGAQWIDPAEALTWLAGRTHPSMRAPEARLTTYLTSTERSAA